MNEITTQRLHSQPNVSTLWSSLLIRGDLMLKLMTLYTVKAGQDNVIYQQEVNILVVNNFRHSYFIPNKTVRNSPLMFLQACAKLDVLFEPDIFSRSHRII